MWVLIFGKIAPYSFKKQLVTLAKMSVLFITYRDRRIDSSIILIMYVCDFWAPFVHWTFYLSLAHSYLEKFLSRHLSDSLNLKGAADFGSPRTPSPFSPDPRSTLAAFDKIFVRICHLKKAHRFRRSRDLSSVPLFLYDVKRRGHVLLSHVPRSRPTTRGRFNETAGIISAE